MNDIIYLKENGKSIAIFNNKKYIYDGVYYCGRPYRLHQAVYCYYNNLQKIPDGYVIHHIDGNKINNDITNLEIMNKIDHLKLHNKNKKFSIESRLKMSKNSLGEKNGFFGKHHTLETKLRISKSISGEKNPMYGRKGKLAPCYGRVGERHPMYGKKGVNNPNYNLELDNHKDEILKMKENKIKTVDIAEKFNVSATTIKNRIRKWKKEIN